MQQQPEHRRLADLPCIMPTLHHDEASCVGRKCHGFLNGCDCSACQDKATEQRAKHEGAGVEKYRQQAA